MMVVTGQGNTHIRARLRLQLSELAKEAHVHLDRVGKSHVLTITGPHALRPQPDAGPQKIYFCGKQGCSHAFDGSVGRRPCYRSPGGIIGKEAKHRTACASGYTWLDVRRTL